jgi:hypothetical protein
MRPRTLPILVGANLVAITFTLWSVGRALSEPVFPLAQQLAAETPIPGTRDLPPINNEAMLSHPLFTSSRTPPSTPMETSVQLPPSPPPRLVGVVGRAANARQALLESPSGEARGLMSEGEVFEGWTVRRIEGNTVRLTQPHATETASATPELSIQLHPTPTPSAATND